MSHNNEHFTRHERVNLAQTAMAQLVETTQFHDLGTSGPITIIRSHVLGPNEFAIDRSDPASFAMPVAWEYPAYVIPETPDTPQRKFVQFNEVGDFLDMFPPSAGWVLANAGARAMELTFDHDTQRLFGCPIAKNGEYITQTALRNYQSNWAVPLNFDRKGNIKIMHRDRKRPYPLRAVPLGCFDLCIAEILPNELRFTVPRLHDSRDKAGHRMISFLHPELDEAQLAS